MSTVRVKGLTSFQRTELASIIEAFGVPCHLGTTVATFDNFEDAYEALELTISLRSTLLTGDKRAPNRRGRLVALASLRSHLVHALQMSNPGHGRPEHQHHPDHEEES